jgi:hypothetical protein
VVGGASKSAFSLTMNSSVGPRMVAPREPRMAPGSAGASEEFHKTPFGSRLIKGTVADAAGADETVDPVAVAVDVFVDEDFALASEEGAGT